MEWTHLLQKLFSMDVRPTTRAQTEHGNFGVVGRTETGLGLG